VPASASSREHDEVRPRVAPGDGGAGGGASVERDANVGVLVHGVVRGDHHAGAPDHTRGRDAAAGVNGGDRAAGARRGGGEVGGQGFEGGGHGGIVGAGVRGVGHGRTFAMRARPAHRPFGPSPGRTFGWYVLAMTAPARPAATAAPAASAAAASAADPSAKKPVNTKAAWRDARALMWQHRRALSIGFALMLVSRVSGCCCRPAASG
jgi:hypothetical protein